ncbi:tyrosine-type recombinase/integrase [Clostridium gelidum]
MVKLYEDVHGIYGYRRITMNINRLLNKQYNHKRIYRLMKLQLPQFSIHGLRHTHATILLLKGENIKVISERLGHKSTQITWDTYSHVLPSMKKQTADLLDNIFDDL